MKTKEKVVAEIIDSKKEFKWRLSKGKQHSPWFKCYDSILKFTFKEGDTWFLAMCYWEGCFPTETPFQIK